MGQSYNIINVDKKQFIEPWDSNCGNKLTEWSHIYNDGSANKFVSLFHFLLSGPWKGDRVYVVGDYAEPYYDESKSTEFDTALLALSALNGGDSIENVAIYGKPVDSINEAVGVVLGKIRENAEDDQLEDWQLVLQKLCTEFDWLNRPSTNRECGYTEGYNVGLHAADYFGFENALDKVNKEDAYSFITPSYICNSETGEYINVRILPKDWIAEETTGRYASVNPLSILLAMGNGQGGGDYFGPNNELAGSWCRYTKGIFFSDSIPEGYRELIPGFTERTSEDLSA